MEISEGAYTLAGVVLGAIATQLTAWLGSRQADQRVIKEALYTLLELHSVLYKLLRLNNRLPELVASLRKLALTISPPQEYSSFMDKILSNMLREAVLPILGQQLDELKDDYAVALLKLAAVDPVSAYRLRGQQSILADLPQATASWQQVVTTRLGAVPVPWEEITAHFQQQLEPQEVAETRELVAEVIRLLAGQLDRRTRHQVAVTLAKPAMNEKKWLAEVEEKMQKAIKGLAHLMPQPAAPQP